MHHVCLRRSRGRDICARRGQQPTAWGNTRSDDAPRVSHETCARRGGIDHRAKGACELEWACLPPP
jgi:hypothetical protein